MKITLLIKVYRKSGPDEYRMYVKGCPTAIALDGPTWKKLALTAEKDMRENGNKNVDKHVSGSVVNEETTIYIFQ